MKKIKQFFGWLFMNKPRPPEVSPQLAEKVETVKEKGVDLAKKEIKKVKRQVKKQLPKQIATVKKTATKAVAKARKPTTARKPAKIL